MRQGDPLNPAHRLGVLIDRNQAGATLHRQSRQRRCAGAGQKHCRSGSAYHLRCHGPTTFLAKEEVFGSVLAIITVKSFDEAMLIANQTDYGLAASLFTSNIKQALRGARAIKAGTVTVNSYGEGDVTTPFGGYKQSGSAGVTMGWRRMTITQIKTIWLDLSDDSADEI